VFGITIPETITDPSLNYSNYRKLLAATQPPCVPFQALYLKELTFIEENVTRLESGWVNFEKLLLLGRVMVTVARLQTVAYKFNEVGVIMDYLKRPPIVLSEKELLMGSRQCEPSHDYGGSMRDGGGGTNNGRRTANLSHRFSRGFSAMRIFLPKGHDGEAAQQ
jgi:hypothetical protein